VTCFVKVLETWVAHGLETQHKHKSNISIVVSAQPDRTACSRTVSSSKPGRRRPRLGAAKKSIIIWAQSVAKDRLPPATAATLSPSRHHEETTSRTSPNRREHLLCKLLRVNRCQHVGDRHPDGLVGDR
jgi:hypothetical protein